MDFKELAAIGSLILEREQAVIDQLNSIEERIVTHNFDEDDWEYLHEDEILVDRLRDYADSILVLSDGLPLPQVSANVAAVLTSLKQTKPSASWKFIPDYDSAVSEPFQRLRSYADAVRRFSGLDDAGTKSAELLILERILQNTARLLHERKVVPRKEIDIQREMTPLLRAAFPDYAQKVVIPGSLKSFLPDGGVKSLKVAIEYKFVASKEELTQALDGVLEDITGYSGSNDWQRFYSVVYMTAPFATEDQFKQHVSSATSWRAILVNGQGKRNARATKAKMKAKPSKRRKGSAKSRTRQKPG